MFQRVVSEQAKRKGKITDSCLILYIVHLIDNLLNLNFYAHFR